MILILSIVWVFIFNTIKDKVRSDLAQPIPVPSATAVPTQKPIKTNTNSKSEKSLFVPYWALNNQKIDSPDTDALLYFGITPGKNGIDKNEAGFKGIDQFLSSAPKGQGKKLVVRMVDSKINFEILKDQAKQNAIINDSLKIARDNGFSGVVLDLEISAVPFDSLIKQVNDFTNRFYNESKNRNINFGLMFYGDSFYRIRPFDIKTLSKNADEFYVMSYDFSKSRGNPGPNFPLRGKEVYGYDMTRMSEDFLRYLPPEKTSVVFGLFGYDWIVDDKETAVSTGESKTYSQIQKEFLNDCDYKDCVIKRKNDSAETEITYIDDANKKHVIWFEDTQSVSKKEKYLKEKGINNFSLWAYSYF